jgi:hypothetical protein
MVENKRNYASLNDLNLYYEIYGEVITAIYCYLIGVIFIWILQMEHTLRIL